MAAKTIVITGGTSGIGEVAAAELARQGARIVLIARDLARADETLTALRKANASADHKVHIAELSRLSEMKRVAGEIAASEPQIDVLLNNAGALFNARQVTEDGLEMTFATNHMAYFVVTNLLLPKLKPGARIVSTASDAHKGARLDFDDLQSEKRYSGFSVYGRSKLCNILFNRELARRLESTGIAANCLHPGFVATRFGDNSGGFFQTIIKVAKPVGAISPEDGAKTIVYLASSPEVEGKSGGYYYKNKLATPTKEAQSDADAERLWDISARLSGVGTA
jgi:NAD(P)-dependent dehydrogenase (short-subunit alcohol dehydrogenase family)